MEIWLKKTTPDHDTVCNNLTCFPTGMPAGWCVIMQQGQEHVEIKNHSQSGTWRTANCTMNVPSATTSWSWQLLGRANTKYTPGIVVEGPYSSSRCSSVYIYKKVSMIPNNRVPLENLHCWKAHWCWRERRATAEKEEVGNLFYFLRYCFKFAILLNISQLCGNTWCSASCLLTTHFHVSA